MHKISREKDYRLLLIRDVHYGTFRSSGIFQNLYFESRILNPLLE